MTEAQLKAAVEKFEALVREQSARSDRIKEQGDFVDYDALDTIVIGVCGGDGIGPVITKESARVLKYMLADDVKAGKVVFKPIDGLTIENRVAANKAIPDDVLEELRSCHVILKGPTTTPQAGDPWPNIESANVAMRKALDLFCNLRPVKVPEEGIDWTFFRENTEGAYAVGSKGVHVTDDLAMDFVVTTTEGTRRIAKLAYDYARRNGKDRVSIITKANVIKTTDGKFLNLCKEVGKDYPEITTDEWYIDILTAKLIDQKRRRDFSSRQQKRSHATKKIRKNTAGRNCRRSAVIPVKKYHVSVVSVPKTHSVSAKNAYRAGSAPQNALRRKTPVFVSTFFMVSSCDSPQKLLTMAAYGIGKNVTAAVFLRRQRVPDSGGRARRCAPGRPGRERSRS